MDRHPQIESNPDNTQLSDSVFLNLAAVWSTEVDPTDFNSSDNEPLSKKVVTEIQQGESDFNSSDDEPLMFKAHLNPVDISSEGTSRDFAITLFKNIL